MYQKITNPQTGRKVSIYAKLGQNILKKYINQCGSGNCSKLRMDNCRENEECIWGTPPGKNRNSCYSSVKQRRVTKVSTTDKKQVVVKPTLPPLDIKLYQKPSNKKQRGCVEATDKNGFTASEITKYANRNSPPYPANQCEEGMVKPGKDSKGNKVMYVVSAPNKNGVKRWVIQQKGGYKTYHDDDKPFNREVIPTRLIGGDEVAERLKEEEGEVKTNFTDNETRAFDLLSGIQGVTKIKITKDTYQDYNNPDIETIIKSITVTYLLSGVGPLEFKFELDRNPNSLAFSTKFLDTRRRFLKDEFTRKLDNLENFGTPEEKRNTLIQALDPNNT